MRSVNVAGAVGRAEGDCAADLVGGAGELEGTVAELLETMALGAAVVPFSAEAAETEGVLSVVAAAGISVAEADGVADVVGDNWASTAPV